MSAERSCEKKLEKDKDKERIAGKTSTASSDKKGILSTKHIKGKFNKDSSGKYKRESHLRIENTEQGRVSEMPHSSVNKKDITTALQDDFLRDDENKNKGEELPGGPVFCYQHKETFAITRCLSCEKYICSSCIGTQDYPHRCMECTTINYDAEQKEKILKSKKYKRKGFYFTLVAIILLFIIPLFLETLLLVVEDRGADVHKGVAYLYASDVYLYLHDEGINNTTGLINLSVKIYLTNPEDFDGENLKVELLIIKNTTIRQEQQETVSILPARTSSTEYFTGLSIKPGNYTLLFIL